MRRVWNSRRPGSVTTTDTRIERTDTDLGTAAQEGHGSVTLKGSAMSLPRERTLILALLLFLAIWIVMMIAMMFPTALIFAEKCFPLGARIAQFAALALILYGALVIVVPAALPL